MCGLWRAAGIRDAISLLLLVNLMALMISDNVLVLYWLVKIQQYEQNNSNNKLLVFNFGNPLMSVFLQFLIIYIR